MLKEGAVFSFLGTLIWFVGNITVSRSGTECTNLISRRNLGPFKDFLVARKCRNYQFDECSNSWISVCVEVRVLVFVSLAPANFQCLYELQNGNIGTPNFFPANGCIV